jgi:hypothetical protein
VTVEQFLDFVQRPENRGRRVELVGRVILEMVASSKKNTALALWIGHLLPGFVVNVSEVFAVIRDE